MATADEENRVMETDVGVLTLGNNELIIHHKPRNVNHRTRGCFGFSVRGRTKIIKISYLHILWAEVVDTELILDYAAKGRNGGLRPKQLRFSLSASRPNDWELWVKSLLGLSYAGSKSKKNVLVLVNPFAGPGIAVKQYRHDIEPLLAAARCQIRMESTRHVGYATELVQDMPDLESWDVIACCSGDGLPYEVMNGLAKRSDATHALKNTVIAQIPCGSGNALCKNLFDTTDVSLATLYLLKGVEQPLDLMSITQGDKRNLSFLSQNLGFLAECDLGTEHLRFIGGVRVIVGYFQRVLNPPKYPCEVAICYHHSDGVSGEQTDASQKSSGSDDTDIPGNGLPPLLFGTVNDKLPEEWSIEQGDMLSVFFAGKLPFVDALLKLFPAAVYDDGYVVIMRANADIGVKAQLKLFWKSLDGSHVEMPEIDSRKAVAYRVTPKREDGYFSVDGENFPIAPFQVEVHKKLGLTLRRPELASQ